MVPVTTNRCIFSTVGMNFGMASPTDRISSYFQEAPGMGASDSRKIRRNCCGLDSQRILLVSIEILLSGDVFLTVCELENGH